MAFVGRALTPLELQNSGLVPDRVSREERKIITNGIGREGPAPARLQPVLCPAAAAQKYMASHGDKGLKMSN